MILNNLHGKYVMVMNKNPETCGACRHKTNLRLVCLSTDDPVSTGEKVRPYNSL